MIASREICRDTNSALSHEWLIKNARGDYAATSISGALTRRQHGLLVASPDGTTKPHVLLAKLDEEVELEGHTYKLGTNEYQNGIIDPDGFLYLQQVTLDGSLAEFIFEGGRFRLTKTVWMAENRAATFVHYQLGDFSAPVQLTLVPLCDYRANDALMQGSADWHFAIEPLPNGFVVDPCPDTGKYRILTFPAFQFTPLDLWYWRFQLRADNHAGTDLYVPGLLRTTLSPGGGCLIVATTEDNVPDIDVVQAMAQARAQAGLAADLAMDKFTPDLFTTV